MSLRLVSDLYPMRPLTLKQIYFHCVYECFLTCMYICTSSVYLVLRPERMFYPLELELEPVVSCHVGTE